ncbi:hypothetical protein V8D89_015039 [Ganoderma adspersum]
MAQLLLIAAPIALLLLWRLMRHFVSRNSLDNIPGLRPPSFVLGNIPDFFSRNNQVYLANYLSTYGPVATLYAFSGYEKWLHIYDPKALHSIYVKDQENYYRGHTTNIMNRMLLGPGLLSTTGGEHRKQRKLLNPVFSAAHMRGLTPIFYAVAGKLRTALERSVKDGPKDLDILAWMGRTALELVGQGMMGYSFEPLVEEVHNDFAEALKAFMPLLVAIQWSRLFVTMADSIRPACLRRVLLDLVPIQSIQHMKAICDVINERSLAIYNEKKAAIERGDQEMLLAMGEGKDMLSILLRENMKAADEDRLPDSVLLAMLSTFTFAGADTTSNGLSRILHLLCEHADVQDRLRAEIRAAIEQYGEEIPYDELSALPYLDAVCRETLRLYAPASFSLRDARQDTVLPLSEPVRGLDGTMMSEIPIAKGTTILANIPACNTNKAVWGEDALEWKPERWLEPLPRSVEEAHVPGIYANLMTFLAGGHACIGFKFSQLEMKVVLCVLLSTFKFELSEKPFVWNFAAISYPSTSYVSSKPEMSLKVSLASP